MANPIVAAQLPYFVGPPSPNKTNTIPNGPVAPSTTSATSTTPAQQAATGKPVAWSTSIPIGGPKTLQEFQILSATPTAREPLARKYGLTTDPWLAYAGYKKQTPSGISNLVPLTKEQAASQLKLGQVLKTAQPPSTPATIPATPATPGTQTSTTGTGGTQTTTTLPNTTVGSTAPKASTVHITDNPKYSFLNDDKYKELPIRGGTSYKKLLDFIKQNKDPVYVKTAANQLSSSLTRSTYLKKSGIKTGTIGYNGTTFNQWQGDGAGQKRIATTPGAGLWSIGIDPKSPTVNEEVLAWLGIHAWSDGTFKQPIFSTSGKGGQFIPYLNDGTFGRDDAKMPGLKKLIKDHPNVPLPALVDAAIREQYAQNSLPPRSFDFMSILDPIISYGLNLAVPGAGIAYSIGRGASEGGALGALFGGLAGAANVTPLALATNIASGIGGQINPDLGLALGLLGGSAQGLAGEGWKNLAGTAAGKVAGELTNDPLARIAATFAARGVAPGPK